MRNKSGVLIVILLFITMVATGYGVYSWQRNDINKLRSDLSRANSQNKKSNGNDQKPTTTFTSLKGVTATIYIPLVDQQARNPVVVLGQIPGNWSFEASFPVQLTNSKGVVIAQSNAQIYGDWMTSSLVPFSAKLDYPTSESGTGNVVLKKDNPSGLPSNDDQISIPVTL